MKILAILMFISISFQACSQQLAMEELESRKKAQIIVDEYLSYQVKDKDYILFSSDDAFFIIFVKDSNSFHEYYIDNSNEFVQVTRRDTIIVGENELYNKMFDVSSYRKDYTSFRTEFYKNGYDISSGSYTYFVMVTNSGVRIGECRLSMFVKPTPMAAEIYLYFVNRMLKNAGRL